MTACSYDGVWRRGEEGVAGDINHLLDPHPGFYRAPHLQKLGMKDYGTSTISSITL